MPALPSSFERSWPTSGLIEILPTDLICRMVLPLGGTCGEMFETNQELHQHAAKHMKSPHLKGAVIGKRCDLNTFHAAARSGTPPAFAGARPSSSSTRLSSPHGPEEQLQQEDSVISGDQEKLVELLRLFRKENKKVEAEKQAVITRLTQTDDYQAMSIAEQEAIEEQIAQEAGHVLNNFIWLLKQERGLDVKLPEDDDEIPQFEGEDEDFEYWPNFHPQGDEFAPLPRVAPHFRNFARGIHKRYEAIVGADVAAEYAPTVDPKKVWNEHQEDNMNDIGDDRLQEDEDMRRDLYENPPIMDLPQLRKALKLPAGKKGGYILGQLNKKSRSELRLNGLVPVNNDLDPWVGHQRMLQIARSLIDEKDHWGLIKDAKDQERVAYAFVDRMLREREEWAGPEPAVPEKKSRRESGRKRTAVSYEIKDVDDAAEEEEPEEIYEYGKRGQLGYPAEERTRKENASGEESGNSSKGKKRDRDDSVPETLVPRKKANVSKALEKAPVIAGPVSQIINGSSPRTPANGSPIHPSSRQISSHAHLARQARTSFGTLGNEHANASGSTPGTRVRDGLEIKRLEMQIEENVCQLFEKLDEYEKKHGVSYQSNVAERFQ